MTSKHLYFDYDHKECDVAQANSSSHLLTVFELLLYLNACLFMILKARLLKFVALNICRIRKKYSRVEGFEYIRLIGI